MHPHARVFALRRLERLSKACEIILSMARCFVGYLFSVSKYKNTIMLCLLTGGNRFGLSNEVS